MKNKKAITLQGTLGTLLVVIAGAIIVILVLNTIIEAAPKKLNPELCKLSIGVKKYTASLSGDVCFTEEVDITPKGSTKQAQLENVAQQIIELAATCWYMTGAGDVENVWENAVFAGQKCFPCYIFEIKIKDSKIELTDTITKSEITNVITKKSYDFQGIDNGCATNGGFCLETCTDKDHPKLTREVESYECGTNEKCCIAPNIKDQCLNHGGECLNFQCQQGIDEKYRYETNKWTCADGKKCCGTQEMAITYQEYFQSGGAIAVISEFKPETKYTIAFVDPSFGRIGQYITKGLIWGVEDIENFEENSIFISTLSDLQEANCKILERKTR